MKKSIFENKENSFLSDKFNKNKMRLKVGQMMMMEGIDGGNKGFLFFRVSMVRKKNERMWT